MRIISHDPAAHNATRKFNASWGLVLLTILVLSALVFASGCGEKSKDQAALDKTPEVALAPDCPVSLDTSGWEAFKILGDQLISGKQASDAELEAFGNLPAITIWRESMTDFVPTAFKVGNWVEEAFWDEVGMGRPQKRSSDRSHFGKAMRLNYDNRTEIDAMLDRFQGENYPCRVYTLAKRWLEPNNLPDPFSIYIVASKSELRTHKGSLVVDTGVLLAGGPEQTSRQLVALLYRDRQAMLGENPLEIEGGPAVANVLRVMMNEGIASWIEDTAGTHFSSVIKRLGKVTFVPEDIFNTGIRAMDILSTNLPGMLEDPTSMQGKGLNLARTMGAAGALTQGGYCMAWVIAERLGEDRLLQVRTSPPAFLEAYQEAAKLNTLPLPIPGAEGRKLYETMPAFPDAVYQGLLQLLEETFPRG